MTALRSGAHTQPVGQLQEHRRGLTPLVDRLDHGLAQRVRPVVDGAAVGHPVGVDVQPLEIAGVGQDDVGQLRRLVQEDVEVDGEDVLEEALAPHPGSETLIAKLVFSMMWSVGLVVDAVFLRILGHEGHHGSVAV